MNSPFTKNCSTRVGNLLNLLWCRPFYSTLSKSSTTFLSVNGYSLPKDTTVVANLIYIHFDPAIWGDPENFRPERHLSPDGKVFKKHEALLDFSIGRRACLGRKMSQDISFISYHIKIYKISFSYFKVVQLKRFKQ